MATKKDLVEAHTFSRRRLVTAFTSGAPGGREVEPVKPMRAVGGGAALCVLLLAVAGVAGFFAPKTPTGWTEDGAVVASRGGGNLYYVDNADPEGDEDSATFREFTNDTSALLFLGADAVDGALTAPADEIAKRRFGPPIGIQDAPGSIPTEADLVDSGWTACTSAGTGIRTLLAEDPQARPIEDGAVTVRTPTGLYLIARANTDPDDPASVAFRIPAGGLAVDNFLVDLGLSGASAAVPVDPDWLALYKQSEAPLGPASFRLGGSGPVGYGATLEPTQAPPGGPRIGDLVVYETSTYLLTARGPALLTRFAQAVWENSTARRPYPLRSQPAVALVPPEEVWPQVWPDQEDDFVPPEDDVCALMEPRPGETPMVLLAGDETDEASSDDVAAGETEEIVASGLGALFDTGGFDSRSGSLTYLVDRRALAYPIEEQDTTLENLGLGAVERPVVPDTWLQLFAKRNPLSTARAGATAQGPGPAS